MIVHPPHMRILPLSALLVLGCTLSCSSVESPEESWEADIAQPPWTETDAAIPFPLLDSMEGAPPDTAPDPTDGKGSGPEDIEAPPETLEDSDVLESTDVPDILDGDTNDIFETEDIVNPETGDGDTNDTTNEEDTSPDTNQELQEDCCTTSEVAGCLNPECEETVCLQDSFCCQQAWDTHCVEAAEELCTSCPGNCCEVTAGPGCAETDCEAAVCGADPFCCATAWDTTCVLEAGDLCDICPGDCCEPSAVGGCANTACQTLICMNSPECCTNSWDAPCVEAAQALCSICPEPPPEPTDCCEAKSTQGCNEPDCEALVCADDPYCCEFTWDSLCVNGAEEVCGLCPGDCCKATPVPGCTDSECEALVCESDSFCCNNAWDSACASAAETNCSGCAPEAPDPTVQSDCCAPAELPGCLDSSCEALVCAEDPFCCDTTWDSACVSGAQQLCTTCPGDCCEETVASGCTNNDCEAAVCGLDDFCCSSAWDTWCAQCASGGLSFNGLNCSGVTASCSCTAPGPSHLELAEHWAPVWYHDTDDTNHPADYITRVDFDGDAVSSNNWENLTSSNADLGAVIYWSMVETETHWFLLYTDFHPRDWTEDCNPFFGLVTEPCHENDMEGAMVVLRKSQASHGTFEALYTEAHNTLHIHVNNAAIQAGTGQLESVGVTFEDGSHPELYVESKGHGVCALYFEASSHCQHPLDGSPPSFPGGDGIIYRHQGSAEVPQSGNEANVSYQLLPFEETIWPLRNDICDGNCMFDGTFNYEGAIVSKAFDGNTHGTDKANPPWAWDDPSDGPVQRGDFFFRPAYTLKTHLTLPGPVSSVYLHNPYLDALFP